MNTQNNEWRDLLPREIIEAGDEIKEGSYWKPVPPHWVGLSKESCRYAGILGVRTRRPLPTPNISDGTPNIPAETPNTSDPIAQAITQMEEAARVLLPTLRDNQLGYGWLRILEDEGQLRFSSPKSPRNEWCEVHVDTLAEAVGYKSPEQEKEEAVKEWHRLMSEANLKEQEAASLRDKAHGIMKEAGV